MSKIQSILVCIGYFLSITSAYAPVKLRSKPTFANDVDFKLDKQTGNNDALRTDTWVTWWAIFSPGKKSDELIDYEVKSYNNRFLTQVPSSTRAWREIVESPKEDSSSSLPSVQSYLYGISPLSELHELHVQKLYKNMKLGNIQSSEKALILDALRFAFVALKGKRTERSKELFVDRISGTVAVLGELKSTIDVILPSILHSILSENTNDNFIIRQYIIERFGANILEKTEKYVRLPKFMARQGDKTTTDPIQSELKVQMLVSMIEDYHSLYIRLADRVHTLRVLQTLKLDSNEKREIALEALNVYAPLAHKMGVKDKKGELEDLAFRFISPEMFKLCENIQVAAHKAYQDSYESVTELVRNDEYLKSHNITAANIKIERRVKDKYQLFLKMQRKGLKSVSDVRDALGLRVIINHPKFIHESDEDHAERGNQLCYYIIKKLGHMPNWEPIPDGFKDYISNVKENGYRSLHQYLYNKLFRSNVEVQVRTRQMHIEAEMGDAAHWSYKDLTYKPEIASSKYYKLAWKSDDQKKAKSSAEFIKMAQNQLKDQIFVFKKDHSTVLPLKRGATSLDAAFAIHSTEIGLKTATVKVNGRPVDYNYQLRSGDVLYIETMVDGSITAKPNWLRMVKTSQAKYTLNKHFKHSQRGIIVSLGCIQLLMAMTMNSEKIKSKYNKLPNANELNELTISNTKYSNIAELLLLLGNSTHTESVNILSSLLAIPKENLKILSVSSALVWAKTLGHNGWNDKVMLNNVLLPLLRELLPSLGIQLIERKWCELVGKRSLSDEHSPYFKALSSFIISSDVKSFRPVSEIIDTIPVNRAVNNEVDRLTISRALSLGI